MSEEPLYWHVQDVLDPFGPLGCFNFRHRRTLELILQEDSAFWGILFASWSSPSLRLLPLEPFPPKAGPSWTRSSHPVSAPTANVSRVACIKTLIHLLFRRGFRRISGRIFK